MYKHGHITFASGQPKLTTVLYIYIARFGVFRNGLVLRRDNFTEELYFLCKIPRY